MIEGIVDTLREAVKEAQKTDPNVMGVIFFGSRTHPGMSRRDSDVDLLPVLKRDFAYTLALGNSVRSKLDPLGLRPDFMGCRGELCVSWVDAVLSSGGKDDGAAEAARYVCRFLNEDSIFIVTDPEAERKIRELVKPALRKWSRQME